MRKKDTAADIIARHDLDEVDKRILQLKVQYPAMTITELAKTCGLTRTSIRRRMDKKVWIAAFNEFHLPAKDLIEKEAARLTRNYLKLAESRDEKVAERVIRAVLTSLGILRNRVDLDGTVFETLTVVKPIAREVIEVTGQKKLEGK